MEKITTDERKRRRGGKDITYLQKEKTVFLLQTKMNWLCKGHYEQQISFSSIYILYFCFIYKGYGLTVRQQEETGGKGISPCGRSGDTYGISWVLMCVQSKSS